MKATRGMIAVRHFTTNQKTNIKPLIANNTGKTKPQLDTIGYLAGLRWVLKTQIIIPKAITTLINTNI
ncbi:MAG: hypothetical protein IKG99_02925 [Bacteroidaceae bacterium]|nr:hypothetical protein [Bacteroidaceae bacterium]